VPRFRLSVTILCAIILLVFYALAALSYFVLPRPARISSPERALAQVVSTSMTLEVGSKRISGWGRLLSGVVEPSAVQEETDDAIHWYEELLTVSEDPVAQIHLAILYGETSQQDKVRAETARWRSRPEPLPTLEVLVRTAYLENSPISDYRFRIYQAVASELLPTRWFRDRLIIQLLKRTPHPELAVKKEQEISLRGERLFRRHLPFIFLDFCLLLVGGAACIKLFRRRNDLTLGQVSIPAPWPGSTGVAVLLRGGALGTFLIALSFFVEGGPLVQTLLLPIISLPVLLLAQKYLFQPTGQPLGRLLGFSVDRKRLHLLFLVVLAGMAVEVAGSSLLGIAGNILHLSDHWTEWFDPDLAWGGRASVAASLFQSVVVAPFFEEIIFRGLLFTTLRRRFDWFPSALISAGIFGLAHGYGILGFLTVFFSGIVWAWMVEKTRSLVPSMIAHAADNLIFTTGVLTLLRGG